MLYRPFLSHLLPLAFATSAFGLVAQGDPTLAGYNLGQRWSEVGRALACERRSNDSSLSRFFDSLSGRQTDWSIPSPFRYCLANDSTELTFKNDTLVSIELRTSSSSVGLDSIVVDDGQHVARAWRTFSGRAQRAFGIPDSVSILDADPAPGTGAALLAIWHPVPNRSWAAHVCVQKHSVYRPEPFALVVVRTVLAYPGHAFPHLCGK